MGVMAVKTGMMSGVWNVRLRDGALSLGQGRCWQNFEQIKAMNFKLTFSGMCLEWKGEGCELRVGGDWLGRDRSVFLPSGSHLGKRQ